MFSIFIILAAPIAFYLLPAILPIWKPFLIVWLTLAVALIAIWQALYFQEVQPDTLTHMLDRMITRLLSLCWGLAGILQAFRGFIRFKGHTAYLHLLAVFAGGCAIIIVAVNY